LYEQYIVQGRSTDSIGREVGRNPKQVYAWLKGYDSEPRARGWSTERADERAPAKPYHDPAWLREEDESKGRSAHDIAAQFGVSDGNVLFFLRQFGIPRRTTRQARALKRWSLPGRLNGMYGKRGAEVPHWKGGVTPERQALYSSEEWADAVKLIWRRDGGSCQRCGERYKYGRHFAIHHIVSFAVRTLRAEPTNLVLLCRACHDWVHSKANTERLFLKPWEGGANVEHPAPPGGRASCPGHARTA
jgi:hypothetical protein